MHEGITPRIIGEATVTPWLPKANAKRKSYARWTDAEVAVMREHYPTGGLKACAPLLPGRSDRTIYFKARKLGLRAAPHRVQPTRWTSSVHIDEAIRRAYRDDPRRGRVKRLAGRLRRPRYWVSYRARQLGLVAPTGPGRPWSAREQEVLVANATKKPISIANILKRHGFRRTPGAIQYRLNAMQIEHVDDDHYTGTGLATLMGVNVHKVAGWIEKGWLKAKRDPGERTHYSIHRRSVRRFIVDNVGAVDIRRVDKFWLVELLAGRADA